MSLRDFFGMNIFRLIFSVLALAGLVSGCATYLEAKQNIAPGGKIERDTNDAKQALENERRENERLQQAKAQREQELQKNERRIHALESELREHDAALAKALKANQVSKAEYNELKRKMDSIRKETAALAEQNDADRLAGASDKKADAAKQERLRQLEQRKKDLETAVAALVKR